MPYLRTNYVKKWLAHRNILGGTAAAAGRKYMGPVEFSINAKTDASGQAVISAQTVQSIFGITPIAGCKIIPLAVYPLSWSDISYSGGAHNPIIPGDPQYSLLMNATSMASSGSLCWWGCSWSNNAVIAGSSHATSRVLAIVTSAR